VIHRLTIELQYLADGTALENASFTASRV